MPLFAILLIKGILACKTNGRPAQCWNTNFKLYCYFFCQRFSSSSRKLVAGKILCTRTRNQILNTCAFVLEGTKNFQFNFLKLVLLSKHTLRESKILLLYNFPESFQFNITGLNNLFLKFYLSW